MDLCGEDRAVPVRRWRHGMRYVAVAALRQIGFSGQQVAVALGLTESYRATLHQRAQREGTAGLVRPRGRPRTLEPSR